MSDRITSGEEILTTKEVAEILRRRVLNENITLRLKKSFTRREMIVQGVKAGAATHPLAVVYQQYVGKLAVNTKWLKYLDGIIEAGDFPEDQEEEDKGPKAAVSLETPVKE